MHWWGWAPLGLGSPLLKVQNTYQTPICISSESNTQTHPGSTPSSHHGRGQAASGTFPRGPGLLGLGLLQEGRPGGGGPVGPRGQLMLQWSPPGVEGVADVVV